MKPKDVYVVYNKISRVIHSVHAIQYFAEEAFDKLVIQHNSTTGTTPNKDKLEVITLEDAIIRIEEAVAHEMRESMYG